MERIEKFMTVWMITMCAMIVIGLPVTIYITASMQMAKRAEAQSIEKPTASLDINVEIEQPEQRKYSRYGLDGFYRFFQGGKYYYDAPKHTYRVAQSITGVLLGTENATENFQVNYITHYGMARICEHGEYWHVSCCNPKVQR